MDFSTVAKLSRFKDIVTTLLKYGLDEAVQRLNFPGAKLIKRIYTVEQEMGIYERIRCVLEDLGPTFVKFGQIMSLRPDLLPSDLLFELSKLQDEVPPAEISEIRAAVEKGLGQSIETVFSTFDNESIAAASISQVHRAVLKKEGSIVVAKVQRPGIRKKIQADLDILESVARRLHENSDDLKPYDLPNLVSVVRRNLIREIDFRIEAQNLRIARTFASGTDVHIPEVYSEYCSEQMLVMEYVQGEKIRDIDPGGEDAQDLAKKGLNAAFSDLPGVNLGAFDALISISSPVCGLRPFLVFLSTTLKVPNPTRVTVSPVFIALVLDDKTQSTASCASFLVLTTLATSLIKSPLFIFISFYQF